MDFEKIAAEFADEISAGPIPEPAAEKVERAGRCLAMNGWNPNVAGEADFTAACSAWAKCTCVPRKGLFIHGSFGCGKTALMEAIRRTVGGLWVNLANPDEAERLDAKVWPNWNADAMRRTVFLDDLGAESAANEYGVRRELAGEFIVAYHRMGEGRLYVTTNLSGENMVDRYGSRVCSRLKELCLPLHLAGADKRKWGGANAPVERRFAAVGGCAVASLPVERGSSSTLNSQPSGGSRGRSPSQTRNSQPATLNSQPSTRAPREGGAA